MTWWERGEIVKISQGLYRLANRDSRAKRSSAHVTSSLSMESLADAVRLHSGPWKGGIAYARRGPLIEKQWARARVLRCFTEFPSNLTILTLPGVGWDFERQLLARREHGKGLVRPRRTFIYALERDAAVFRASMTQMPGIEVSGIVTKEPPKYAAHAVRTLAIQRFYECDFRDFAPTMAEYQYDGAWLDFTGQLTDSLLVALRQAWVAIRSTMTVTTLNSRWDGRVATQVARIGVAGTLAKATGATVHDVYEYQDSSPMIQVTLGRTTPR